MKRKVVYILLIFLIFFLNDYSVVYADLKTEAQSKSCEELEQEGKLNASDGKLLFDPGDRDVNCIYSYTKKEFLHDDRCILFQIAFNSNDGSNQKVEAYGTPTDYIRTLYQKKFLVFFHEAVLTDAQYFADLNGLCPISVEYKLNGAALFIFDGNQNMRRIYSSQIETEIPSLITPVQDPSDISCADSLGDDGVKILKVIKSLVFIAVPIIMLILGSLDFVKAIFAGDEDKMKKAQSIFVKRLIIGVGIFLIPGIMSFILKIANLVWPVIDTTLCGIL